MMKTMLVGAMLALLLATPAAAQIRPPKTAAPPHSYVVQGNIHVAVVEDRNCPFVIGDDSILQIETNYKETAPLLKKLLASVSPKPVHLVINSHWHADHVGGNALFAKDGAVTLAQENTRKRMMSDQHNPFTGHFLQAGFGPEYLPMLTFKNTMTVHFGGHDIDLVYYPDAHTDGDIVLYFRDANVVYTGGLLTYPTYAGIWDTNGFVSALDKMLAQVDDNTKIIPWQGPVVGKAQLREWRDVLATSRDRIQRMIDAGMTEDQVVAARPTKDFDAKWGKHRKPEVFVRNIYEDLKSN